MAELRDVGPDQGLVQALRTETQRWEACGIEDKVERLRRALMDLRWGVQDARKRSAQFENHQHDANGEIVIPLRARSGESEASMRDLLA